MSGSGLCQGETGESAFVPPVTARPNKWRQELNLRGHFIQMIGADRGLCVLKDRLTFPFKPTVFIKRGKITGNGFGIQGEKYR